MVNINGLTEVNGENYPLDIWSLYMQNAVQMFPVQQFDVPSPYLDLEVKTDGRTYVKPEEPKEKTDVTTESTNSEEKPHREPAARETVQPLQPAPRLSSPAPQATAPPAARPARDGEGQRRGPPAANDGPRRRPLR
jgi:penicillin-binding protein 1A